MTDTLGLIARAEAIGPYLGADPNMVNDLIASLRAEKARADLAPTDAQVMAAWRPAPVPTDRPVIALPSHGDGLDASVTWWVESDGGRWANWPWTHSPIGWIEIPADPPVLRDLEGGNG